MAESFDHAVTGTKARLLKTSLLCQYLFRKHVVQDDVKQSDARRVVTIETPVVHQRHGEFEFLQRQSVELRQWEIAFVGQCDRQPGEDLCRWT